MKSVIVTTSWDDGHRLDVRLAALLKKYDVQGTFYVAPRNCELRQVDLLTDEQIKALSVSFEIGAHTLVHKKLTELSDKVANSEIVESKKYLETLIGKAVNTFCYPCGNYRQQHVKMVHDAGYTYARTVRRHSFDLKGFPFEAQTSIHTYNHWLDLWKIFRFAGFNPIKTVWYFQWDNLAKAMFDRVLETGGIFHLWGHSWEIDKHNDWEKLEEVLRYISKKQEVLYVNNGELPNISLSKKLLLVAPYFLPHMGGVEFYIYNIAKQLQATCGWDISIVTSGGRGMRSTVEVYEGFKVYRLPYWFKFSNTPLNFWWPIMLTRIFKKEHADLINVHAPVPGLPDLAGWLSGLTPVVVTYHSGSMIKKKTLSNILIWAYEKGPLNWLLRKANYIVCSSDFVRDDFLGAYTHKSITITPGVDTVMFKPDPNQIVSHNTVLFVAGLSRSQQFKGLKSLIEAVKIVEKTVPTIQLVVVGDGDMKAEYEAYAIKLGLAGSVVFKGKLTGGSLVQAYQQADVLVLPSSSPAESFGMVLVEAMACKKPVIGTNLGGIPHVIDHEKNGLLIPEKNADSLVIAIKRVLQDEAFSNFLGENGLAKARMTFDWGTRVSAYDDLFTMLMNKKRPVAQIAGYYPPHLGGLEVVAREISLELARNGHPVTVITSNITGTKTVPIEEPKQNYDVKRLNSLEFAHSPIMWTLPWRLLQLPRGSIIHMHVAHAIIPEIAYMIAKIRNFPLVAHFHLDVGPSGSLGWLLPFYKKYVLGFVLRRVNKVIVFSEVQSKLVQEKYQIKESNIAIIPNGVGENFFYYDTRPTPTDRLQLLYVGRLSVQKRVDRLVDMLALLKVPVHLTIVGDGEDREELEVRAQKLGVNNVTFEGKKSGEELISYYRKADVFVIASDVEGMPLVVLEAMAGGLPVVVSNVLGLQELVEGVGVLVDNPSPQTFANALTNLWETPEQLQELSKKSLAKANQHSWKKLVQKVESLYKTL